METYCEGCREITKYTQVKEKSALSVKGVECTIDDSFYRCSCGQEINDTEFDSMEAYYKEYKRITGRDIKGA